MEARRWTTVTSLLSTLDQSDTPSGIPSVRTCTTSTAPPTRPPARPPPAFCAVLFRRRSLGKQRILLLVACRPSKPPHPPTLSSSSVSSPPPETEKSTLQDLRPAEGGLIQSNSSAPSERLRARSRDPACPSWGGTGAAKVAGSTPGGGSCAARRRERRSRGRTGFHPSWSTFLQYCVVSKKN